MHTRTIHLLASYAPLRARKFWTLINALLCLWSILLLIELLFISTPLERLESTQAYLTYNFGMTLVWVIEVCLNLCDHYRNRRQQRQIPMDGWQNRQSRPCLAIRLLDLMLLVYTISRYYRWYQKSEYNIITKYCYQNDNTSPLYIPTEHIIVQHYIQTFYFTTDH